MCRIPASLSLSLSLSLSCTPLHVEKSRFQMNKTIPFRLVNAKYHCASPSVDIGSRHKKNNDKCDWWEGIPDYSTSFIPSAAATTPPVFQLPTTTRSFAVPMLVSTSYFGTWPFQDLSLTVVEDEFISIDLI